MDFVSPGEREHYNKLARLRPLEDYYKGYTDGPFRQAYQAWLSEVSRPVALPNAKILDYCCGQGEHAVTLQRTLPHADIEAIDISDRSIEMARELAEQALNQKTPHFQVMNAHELNFPAGYFDLVSDFGSLSSLDFDLALGEISRVLKPGGRLVALETFGHNPAANLKRRLNVHLRRRTQWAADHILKHAELLKLQTAFPNHEVYYFGLSTLGYAALPFKKLPLLTALEHLDAMLLKKFPSLSFFAFKVVFVGIKGNA